MTVIHLHIDAQGWVNWTRETEHRFRTIFKAADGDGDGSFLLCLLAWLACVACVAWRVCVAYARFLLACVLAQ